MPLIKDRHITWVSKEENSDKNWLIISFEIQNKPPISTLQQQTLLKNTKK